MNNREDRNVKTATKEAVGSPAERAAWMRREIRVACLGYARSVAEIDPSKGTAAAMIATAKEFEAYLTAGSPDGQTL